MQSSTVRWRVRRGPAGRRYCTILRAIRDDSIALISVAVGNPAIAVGDREAVALALMERVAANVDQIIERLEARGYEFGRYPDGKPVPGLRGVRIGPSEEMLAAIDTLAARVGALPLSLRSFWQVVGEVTLVGRDPEGGLPVYSDPLWLEGPDIALAELEDDGGMEDGGDAFFCPIAPDVFHKDNGSGGTPYTIALPNGAFDARLEGEWRKLDFVAYLRTAILDWGGFPGISERSPQQRWRRDDPIAPWIVELKKISNLSESGARTTSPKRRRKKATAARRPEVVSFAVYFPLKSPRSYRSPLIRA